MLNYAEMGGEYLEHYGVKGMKWRRWKKNVKEQDERYKHLRAHDGKPVSLSSRKGNDGKWTGRYTLGFGGKTRNNPTGEYRMFTDSETVRDRVKKSNKKRYRKSVR